MFLRPRKGVERLIDALREDVGTSNVRTSTPATGLEHGDADAWRVRTPEGAVEARTVILTVDAPTAARLVPAGTASAELARIPFVSTGVVALVYAEGTGPALPDGSGFVVPRGAAPMTACTWISNKWPDPAFGGRAVLRCFVGAAGEEDVLDAEDRDLIEACARHLAALLPLPPAPADAAVVRWPRAMPQYLVGHLDRVARIRAELPAGIFVCGRALDGVGVADCVRSAGETADAIAAHLDREVHA